MKVCILGGGLTSLALAKALINLEIYVDIFSNINHKQNKSRTLGLSESQSSSKPTKVNEIDTSNNPRLDLKDEELNRVLGGGIVPGSLVLIGGEPGIGKSTLLLQISLLLKINVLYVSGEESQQQIKERHIKRIRTITNSNGIKGNL